MVYLASTEPTVQHIPRLASDAKRTDVLDEEERIPQTVSVVQGMTILLDPGYGENSLLPGP